MNERKVFLVSDVGEICIGTVEQLINLGVSERRRKYRGLDLLLMDLVGNMIGDGNLSSTITIELRDPTRE